MKKHFLTVTTLSFEELSAEVKSKLYEEWKEKNHDFIWSMRIEEAKSSLGVFCHIFDIHLHDYAVYENDYSCVYYVSGYHTVDMEDKFTPIRLAKFIWNHYSEYISQGKYYSKIFLRKNESRQQVSRHSKNKVLYPFSITGMCYDYPLVETIIDCLTYKKFYTTLKELYDECFDNFFHYLMEDIKNSLSYESFEEEMLDAENEYLEDGRIFTMP